jgi:MoxR-like ATPase
VTTLFSAKKAAASSAGRERLRSLSEVLRARVLGQEEAVEGALLALLGGGHLLLEGPPGVGKTSLAQAVAGLFHGTFRRIQMTSDLLPSDVVGSLRPRPGSMDLEFRPGPIFCNVLLADELNRTSAKTQAALLEAMAERRVSVDGVSHELPDPFFVVATQNPQEFHGVYPLSESQLDRFMIHVTLGLPSAEAELAVYRRHGAGGGAGETFTPLSVPELLACRAEVARVFAEDSVLRYVQAIAQEIRRADDVVHAASVRAVLQLIDAAKVRAYLAGREFVLPDDVGALAPAVLGHRLCFRAGEFSSLQCKELVRNAVGRVDAPK